MVEKGVVLVHVLRTRGTDGAAHLTTNFAARVNSDGYPDWSADTTAHKKADIATFEGSHFPAFSPAVLSALVTAFEGSHFSAFSPAVSSALVTAFSPAVSSALVPAVAGSHRSAFTPAEQSADWATN